MNGHSVRGLVPLLATATMITAVLVTAACSPHGYDPDALPTTAAPVPSASPTGPPESARPSTPPATPAAAGTGPSAPAVPPADTDCPASGVSITAGHVEAALGHRASVLTMVNCGTRPYEVTGYPHVGLLDPERRPLTVTVQNGSSYMGRDPGFHRLALAPRASVRAVLAWSGTVTYGDAVNGAYLVVAPAPGQPAQTLALDTDLGTTGLLQVTAWASELAN